MVYTIQVKEKDYWVKRAKSRDAFFEKIANKDSLLLDSNIKQRMKT